VQYMDMVQYMVQHMVRGVVRGVAHYRHAHAARSVTLRCLGEMSAQLRCARVGDLEDLAAWQGGGSKLSV